MIGDGKTAYDHDHDNEADEAAACSVSMPWARCSRHCRGRVGARLADKL
jgi:hypothetical protein